jgi:hypothetical protein
MICHEVPVLVECFLCLTVISYGWEDFMGLFCFYEACPWNGNPENLLKEMDNDILTTYPLVFLGSRAVSGKVSDDLKFYLD